MTLGTGNWECTGGKTFLASGEPVGHCCQQIFCPSWLGCLHCVASSSPLLCQVSDLFPLQLVLEICPAFGVHESHDCIYSTLH